MVYPYSPYSLYTDSGIWPSSSRGYGGPLPTSTPIVQTGASAAAAARTRPTKWLPWLLTTGVAAVSALLIKIATTIKPLEAAAQPPQQTPPQPAVTFVRPTTNALQPVLPTPVSPPEGPSIVAFSTGRSLTLRQPSSPIPAFVPEAIPDYLRRPFSPDTGSTVINKPVEQPTVAAPGPTVAQTAMTSLKALLGIGETDSTTSYIIRDTTTHIDTPVLVVLPPGVDRIANARDKATIFILETKPNGSQKLTKLALVDDPNNADNVMVAQTIFKRPDIEAPFVEASKSVLSFDSWRFRSAMAQATGANLSSDNGLSFLKDLLPADKPSFLENLIENLGLNEQGLSLNERKKRVLGWLKNNPNRGYTLDGLWRRIELTLMRKAMGGKNKLETTLEHSRVACTDGWVKNLFRRLGASIFLG
jgi:hypothetical protein